MKSIFFQLFGLLPIFLPLQRGYCLQNGQRSIEPGDIIVNEILSNPKSDGVDFVELYNHSGKTIDLQHLSIASVNSNGVAGRRRKISWRSSLSYPEEYKGLTTSP